MQTQLPGNDAIVAVDAEAGGLAPDPALAPGLPERLGRRLKLIYGNGGRIETLDEEGRVTGQLAMASLEAAIPCFTPGTAIATATGPCTAEDLRPGDRVATRDHGFCEIVWIGRHDYDWRVLGLNPLLRPVMIRAGALGQGLPTRDLVVSPNHRMLVGRRRVTAAEDAEALVPVRELIGRPGIARDDRAGVGYLQILLARHEAILAEGAWSESYQPDRASLAGLGAGARAGLERAMPGIVADGSPGFAPVRATVAAAAVTALLC